MAEDRRQHRAQEVQGDGPRGEGLRWIRSAWEGGALGDGGWSRGASGRLWKTRCVLTNGIFQFSLDFLAESLVTVGKERPGETRFFWPLALVGP